MPTVLKRAVARSPLRNFKVLGTPKRATKSRHQPAARISQVVATSAAQAHGLRSALGLRNDAEQDQALAQRMTQARQRAAKAKAPAKKAAGLLAKMRVWGERLAKDPDKEDQIIAEMASHLDELEHPKPTAKSARLPEPARDATVYTAVTELYVKAARQPITLAAAELAGMTGLSAAEVNAAIGELERRRLLTRQPGRSGSVPLFAPAAL